MAATALTEQDVLQLAYDLFEYSPLPDQLSSNQLGTDSGLDAALDMSERIHYVFQACKDMHPKITACRDAELLRKLVCILQTSMKVVGIIEDWSPSGPSAYEGREFLEDKARLLQKARHLRRLINPTFTRLIRRIAFLTDRPASTI